MTSSGHLYGSNLATFLSAYMYGQRVPGVSKAKRVGVTAKLYKDLAPGTANVSVHVIKHSITSRYAKTFGKLESVPIEDQNVDTDAKLYNMAKSTSTVFEQTSFAVHLFRELAQITFKPPTLDEILTKYEAEFAKMSPHSFDRALGEDVFDELLQKGYVRGEAAAIIGVGPELLDCDIPTGSKAFIEAMKVLQARKLQKVPVTAHMLLSSATTPLSLSYTPFTGELSFETSEGFTYEFFVFKAKYQCNHKKVKISPQLYPISMMVDNGANTFRLEDAKEIRFDFVKQTDAALFQGMCGFI